MNEIGDDIIGGMWNCSDGSVLQNTILGSRQNSVPNLRPVIENTCRVGLKTLTSPMAMLSPLSFVTTSDEAKQVVFCDDEDEDEAEDEGSTGAGLGTKVGA